MQNQPADTEDLKHIHLFASLDPRQLERVQRSMVVLHLDECQTLFEQGQRAERFYYVSEGQMKLFLLSPNGDEKVVEIIKAGHTFAEAVMFMETHRYPVTSQAIMPTTLLSFDSNVYLALLRESPATCLRLLGGMSMRLHWRIKEIDELTRQNATYRLVHFLIHELPPELEAGEADLRLDTPKNIIASRLSIKPETFSRILQSLARDGLLKVEGATVHILDVQRLRGYSAE